MDPILDVVEGFLRWVGRVITIGLGVCLGLILFCTIATGIVDSLIGGGLTELHHMRDTMTTTSTTTTTPPPGYGSAGD